MKKLSITLCACVALSGCTFGFDPDVDSAAGTRNSHRADYRAEFGCPLTDDHEAYRQCLINTYYGTHPKTYRTTVDEKGRSVAVVKDETKSSYDKDTGNYKTERVIVIETTEELVPASSTIPPIPMPQLETVKPAPVTEIEKNFDEVEIVETTPVQKVSEPVKEAPAATWWDTYQKNKPTDQKVKEGCPCENPNDPCPQCYDK